MITTKVTIIATENYILTVAETETIQITDQKSGTCYKTDVKHLCELLKMEELNK